MFIYTHSRDSYTLQCMPQRGKKGGDIRVSSRLVSSHLIGLSLVDGVVRAVIVVSFLFVQPCALSIFSMSSRRGFS